MNTPLDYSLEMHSRSATVYFRGAMSVGGALRAIRTCHDLPPGIRTLCVNLHAVRLYDPMAVDAFVALLREWRIVRSGITRVEMPRAHALAAPPMG